MEWREAIKEAKGERKRKQSLKDKYGEKNYKDYEDCVKKLKGKEGYTIKGGGKGTGKYNIYAVCSKALKK